MSYNIDYGTFNTYSATNVDQVLAFNFDLSELPTSAQTFAFNWLYYKMAGIRLELVPEQVVNTSSYAGNTGTLQNQNFGQMAVMVAPGQQMVSIGLGGDNTNWQSFIRHPGVRIHKGNKKIKVFFKPKQLADVLSTPEGSTNSVLGVAMVKPRWQNVLVDDGTDWVLDQTQWGSIFMYYNQPTAPVAALGTNSGQVYQVRAKVYIAFKGRTF